MPWKLDGLRAKANAVFKSTIEARGGGSLGRSNLGPEGLVYAQLTPAVTSIVRHAALQALREAAMNATVLYHDATFKDDDGDRAKATYHSTTKEGRSCARLRWAHW